MCPVFIACQVERKDVSLVECINVPCIYRMPSGKDVPLAECINVPCIYRMPGVEDVPLAESINVPCIYGMPGREEGCPLGGVHKCTLYLSYAR